jgi:FKBP-type peptidyl-prolyl cis-trans isomerase
LFLVVVEIIIARPSALLKPYSAIVRINVNEVCMAKDRMFPKLEGTKLEGFDPISIIPELEIIDIVEGGGDECPKWATITAHYTGALCADGTIFQSSHDMDRPITFSLEQVIVGWQEGVPGMKVGGTRRLLIPAEMAYGSASPSKNIPKNSDLVFDIELVAIK